jgi:tRNA(fMet)-specific endonuclease VapC
LVFVIVIVIFLSNIEIKPFDSQAAEEYGIVRTELEKVGQPIGPLDTQIAAHARSLGLTLVTNNTREFKRISKLIIEDWTV